MNSFPWSLQIKLACLFKSVNLDSLLILQLMLSNTPLLHSPLNTPFSVFPRRLFKRRRFSNDWDCVSWIACHFQEYPWFVCEWVKQEDTYLIRIYRMIFVHSLFLILRVTAKLILWRFLHILFLVTLEYILKLFISFFFLPSSFWFFTSFSICERVHEFFTFLYCTSFFIIIMAIYICLPLCPMHFS